MKDGPECGASYDQGKVAKSLAATKSWKSVQSSNICKQHGVSGKQRNLRKAKLWVWALL